MQLLTSVPNLPRSTLQSSTLAAAREYEREARRRIQHMNIAGSDLELKNTKKQTMNLGQFGQAPDDWDAGITASLGRNLRSAFPS